MIRQGWQGLGGFDDTHLQLPTVPLFPDAVPSSIIDSQVFIYLLPGCLEGIMRCIESHIMKEGHPAVQGLIQELHGIIHIGIRGIELLIKF
jgi:hypothetical protein